MASNHDAHRVPLWGLFLVLLLFTAAEVALFETWSRWDAFHDALPKFALVLLILAFTLPKALIVAIFFMHLKFEKQLVVMLAIAPFMFVCIAVLTILTDTMTLKGNNKALNAVAGLGEYVAVTEDHGGDAHSSEDQASQEHADEPAEAPAHEE